MKRRRVDTGLDLLEYDPVLGGWYRRAAEGEGNEFSPRPPRQTLIDWLRFSRATMEDRSVGRHVVSFARDLERNLLFVLGNLGNPKVDPEALACVAVCAGCLLERIKLACAEKVASKGKRFRAGGRRGRSWGLPELIRQIPGWRNQPAATLLRLLEKHGDFEAETVRRVLRRMKNPDN